jgi:hypothetical protein
MENEQLATVDQSLAELSKVVGKACVDLLTVKSAIDLARIDIGGRNTSLTRDLLRHAEHVIDHLRGADQSLRAVLTDLKDRD